jgi:hypothetical protein
MLWLAWFLWSKGELHVAFVVLRRSRNTRSFYLVESYRDAGKSRKRTLCYLGREQDGTDTLAKALRHWKRIEVEARESLTQETGPQREVWQRRLHRAEERVRFLAEHVEQSTRMKAEKPPGST